MKYYKYSYKEKIIPIVFVLLIVIVLFLPLEISSPNGLLIDIPLLILMFILHEVLHAVGFRFFGRAKSKNITYGVNLEKGVFYCTCKEEISKKGILISLCLPFIIISLIGGILGIIFSINTLSPTPPKIQTRVPRVPISVATGNTIPPMQNKVTKIHFIIETTLLSLVVSYNTFLPKVKPLNSSLFDIIVSRVLVEVVPTAITRFPLAFVCLISSAVVSGIS